MHFCKTEDCVGLITVLIEKYIIFVLELKINRTFAKPVNVKNFHSCFDPWLTFFFFCLFVSSRLLLQLTTEAHAAETSMAFGFSLKSCRHLLEAAVELGVQVVGVTFHIPSSCQDLQQAYTHALSDARCVFDMGVSAVWEISLVIQLFISRDLVGIN